MGRVIPPSAESAACDSSPQVSWPRVSDTSDRVLSIFVRGVPRPKGSPRPIRNRHTGRVAMVIDSDAARQWGQDVAIEAARARGLRQAPIFGPGVPVALSLVFVLPRRKSDVTSAGLPKRNAPHYHTVTPDPDKLERTVLDALKHGGWYHDDSQVAVWTGQKIYGEDPGVHVTAKAVSDAGQQGPLDLGEDAFG